MLKVTSSRCGCHETENRDGICVTCLTEEPDETIPRMRDTIRFLDEALERKSKMTEREKHFERRIDQLRREVNTQTRIANEAKRGAEVVAADRDRFREQVEKYERARVTSAIDSGEPDRDALRIAELKDLLQHRDRALRWTYKVMLDNDLIGCPEGYGANSPRCEKMESCVKCWVVEALAEADTPDGDDTKCLLMADLQDALDHHKRALAAFAVSAARSGECVGSVAAALAATEEE